MNESDTKLTFAQGLQVFFVHKILKDRHTFGSLVGSPRGDAFFRKWSEIVREEPDRSQTTQVRKSAIEPGEEETRQATGLAEAAGTMSRSGSRTGPKTRSSSRAGGAKSTSVVAVSEQHFAAIVERAEFASLLHLLADEELGKLMTIAYPANTSGLAAASGSQEPDRIVREAVARELGKDEEAVTRADYEAVKELNLSGSDIRSLLGIITFIHLKIINLNNTQVADLEPIKALTNLQGLYLDNTQVADLEPIKALTNLIVLYLDNTQVADLEPIKALTNLQRLTLNGTQVSDAQVSELRRALPDANIEF